MNKEIGGAEYHEFQEAYQRFVLEKGVMFEEKMMPMDDSDKKRLGEFFITMWGLILVFTIGYGFLLYYKWPQVPLDLIYAVGMGLVLGGGSIGLIWFRKKLLTKNEKSTFTGVITGIRGNKWKGNEKIVFQLSNTDEFRVIPKDHDTYGLGEIVRIEYLGSYPGMIVAYPKVVLLGRLPFAIDRQPLEGKAKARRIWSLFRHALFGR